MTKPKYASADARKAALSVQAKVQMQAQWKRQREGSGQALGYYGCHRRVRKERGRAADQACWQQCGAPARHWAHIHGSDPTDPENYRALCQKCHWAYDKVGAKAVAAKSAEGRSALAVLAWSRRSPEQRQAIIQKAWATRRAARASSDSPLAGPG